MFSRSSNFSSVAGIAAGLSMAAGALGQCPEIRYDGMPDFDQGRSEGCANGNLGLPGGGGSFCAPSSTATVFAYLANHGYPGLTTPNGVQDWQQQSHYNAVTTMILDLGGPMGCSATSGAYLGMVDPITDWWAERYPDVDVELPGISLDLPTIPTPHDAWEFMNAGAMVWLGVKWYKWDEEGQYWNKSGAHVTTLWRATNTCGTLPNLGIRDPGSGGDGCTQSTFTSRDTTCTPVNAMYEVNVNGGAQNAVAALWRLDAWNGNTKAVLGGIRAMFPPSLISRIDASRFRRVRPWWWNPGPGPVEDVVLPAGVLMNEMAAHPHQTSVYFTSRPGLAAVAIPPRLWRYKLGDRSFQAVASFGISSTPGPMVFDSEGFLYLIEGGLLRKYSTRGAMVAQVASIELGRIIEDIAFDEVHQQIYGVSAATDQLMRFPTSLASQEVMALPVSARIGGAGMVAVDPQTGNPWVMGSNLGKAFELFPPDPIYPPDPIHPPDPIRPGQEATLPGGLTPTSMERDRRGGLLVCSGGEVQVFRHDVGSGRWEPDERSPFHNIQGEAISMPRARNAMIDSQETDPHVLPPCPADFNGVGGVSVQDLFDFLAAYFARSPGADFNNRGGHTVQDIFDYLNAYFTRCE